MSLSLEFQVRTIVDSSWEFDLLLMFDCFDTLPIALSARISYLLPASMATITFTAHNHESLLKSHIPCSLATIAFLCL